MENELNTEISKEKPLDNSIRSLKYHYQKIENFFQEKHNLFDESTQLSIDKVLSNAPKYYPFIRFIEKFYISITNNKEWLKKYITSRNIVFDWNKYQLWLSGKEFYKRKYDNTQCPSRWITEITEQFIELLKMLQILLYIECYTPEEDFKLFLKKNPVIDYKMKANYKIKSLPSQDLDLLFDIINRLLKINIEAGVSVTYVIDTVTCISAYRFIDESGIFPILKQKEFYITYRLEFLRLTPETERLVLPEESDVIQVAENFLMASKGLLFTYNEYKQRLIEKQEKVKQKLNFK